MPQKRTLDEFWPAWRHDGQAPPPAFAGAGADSNARAGRPPRLRSGQAASTGSGQATWSIVAARGFGKTRAGAEWVSEIARSHGAGTRIALVGATIEDALKVMVTGQSGLAAVARTGEAVRLHKNAGIVTFASGAQAFLYSGACPEKLRGPQHHFAWCDEIAKWRCPEETWDNLQLGLRLGERPRCLVTTTPRPLPFLKRLIAASAVTGGAMADNFNLPGAFVESMEAAYRGTRKGRAELDGEMVEEAEGALWTRALIEKCRCDMPHPNPVRGQFCPPDRTKSPRTPEEEGLWRRVVVAVDPPGSADGDACGIVACGLGRDGIGYVLGDHSVRGLSPEGWAARAVAAAEAWGAGCVVVEKNQGGDMAMSVLRTADPALPVRPVHARFGKGDRAEPVAMLFETGKARFAGAFPELEDELCAMTRGGGYAGRGSPDRADALVWAMTELLLGREAAEPRVRGF